MKRILVIVLIAGFYNAHAQNDIDALRYSKTKFGTTARSAGIGGAVGSLGAEIASTSVNPAAIGMFRRNDFSISMGMFNYVNNSNYLGNNTKEGNFNVTLPNIGLIFYEGKDTDKYSKDWLTTVISFNISRVADFNKSIIFSGVNTQTSLMDYFAERANGNLIKNIRGTDDDFDNGFTSKTSMAWEAYLFDSSSYKQYIANTSPIFHNIFQKVVLNQSGKMYDFNFTYTKGYKNVFFVGASVTGTFVNFEESKKHSEINDSRDTSAYSIDNFVYSEKLHTSGGGLSGRIGIMQKLGDYIRIGAAFQTPQRFELKDEYSFAINSMLRNEEEFSFESKNGEFEYSIITPYKFTLSATAIAGKIGFLSSDVEFIDYSSMRLKSKTMVTALDNANDEIREKYKKAINYRVGGELMFGIYRFRGGYAMYSSPFKEENFKDHISEFITGGFGIKDKDWSLDLGLILEKGKETYQPYVLNDKTREKVFAINDISSFNFVTTFIRRF